MAKRAETAALIIAVGETGTGPAPDPLRPVGSLAAVERVILLFKRAGISRVAVVSDESSHIEKHISHAGVVYLPLRPAPGLQMFDAVKHGLAYLQGKCARVLVTPVDVPLYTTETIQKLADSSENIAIPSHERAGGHPVAISDELFPQLLAYEGDGGLAAAIKHTGAAAAYLEVQDAGVVLDIEKEPNFVHLLQSNSLSELHPGLKLSVDKERPFFGPGPCLLLELVHETGSLRMACTQMGISYSKGWRIIAGIEEQYGCPVLQSTRGGAQRGNSTLTSEGARLMRAYQAFQRESEAEVRRIFERHFTQGGAL